MEAAPHPWPALGVLLMREGLVSKEELEEILAEQHDNPQHRVSGRRLGEVLIQRGKVTPGQVARLVAEQYELPFVEFDIADIDLRVATILREDDARRFSALPISSRADGTYLLAIADPGTVIFSEELRALLGSVPRFAVVGPDAIERAIDFVYKQPLVLEAAFDANPVGEEAVVLDFPPGGPVITVFEEKDLEVPHSETSPLLGALLIRDGFLSEGDLDAALAQQRLSPGRRLGEILVEKGAVTPAVIARLVAEQYEMRYFDLGALDIDRSAAARLSDEVARRLVAVPIAEHEDGSLDVAISDPTGATSSDELQRELGVPLTIVMAAPDAILALLDDLQAPAFEPVLVEVEQPSATVVEELAAIVQGEQVDAIVEDEQIELRDHLALVEAVDNSVDDVGVKTETETETETEVDAEVEDEIVAPRAAWRIEDEFEVADVRSQVEDDAPDGAIQGDVPESESESEPEPEPVLVSAEAVSWEPRDQPDVLHGILELEPVPAEIAPADTEISLVDGEPAPPVTFEDASTEDEPGWASRLELVDEVAQVDDPEELAGYVDDDFELPFMALVETAAELAHVESEYADESFEPVSFDVEVAPEADPTDGLAAAIDDALAAGAVTFHFSPAGSHFVVRARIDGVVTELGAVSRDGRDSLIERLEGDDLARTYVATTSRGDKATLFRRDQPGSVLTLDELGPEGTFAEVIRAALEQPTGAMLFCGPVGSGTTTTLYAVLRELASPTRVVTTIEQPVEHVLEGIDQIEVNPALGANFASALRQVRFMDSDAVMVGDILDRETAELVLRDAGEGRLVLAGFHAPSAAAAIRRLAEMGVESRILGSSLGCLVAQQLVRTICPDCRETYYASEAELELLGLDEDEGPRLLARGRGCESCSESGLRGRTGLFEVLTMTDEIRELVADGSSVKKIQRAAVSGGMRTIREEGVRLCLEGVTSVAEIERVLGL